jgi:N-acetyltransferase
VSDAHAPVRPFDRAPTLEGHGLLLRPLAGADLEALIAAAADPAIWAQHPASDRHHREVFEPYARRLLALGGTLVVAEAATGAIIGCSRFYQGPDAPEDIAIGFTFLVTRHWGGATNRAIKRLMLDHAFRTFDTVWFHIGPDNIRSQKATAKLGAECRRRAMVDIGMGPTDYLCFALARDHWRAGLGAATGAGR